MADHHSGETVAICNSYTTLVRTRANEDEDEEKKEIFCYMGFSAYALPTAATNPSNSLDSVT